MRLALATLATATALLTAPLPSHAQQGYIIYVVPCAGAACMPPQPYAGWAPNYPRYGFYNDYDDCCDRRLPVDGPPTYERPIPLPPPPPPPPKPRARPHEHVYHHDCCCYCDCCR